MEADWEVEIGGDSPVIDACWDGFVDLRSNPNGARELPEAINLPALAEALIHLNGQQSPVWTAKCDAWPIPNASDLDPDELSATSAEAAHGWACYIDLLPRNGSWPPSVAEKSLRMSFVKGHDFSCAEKPNKVSRALAPEGSSEGDSRQSPSVCAAYLSDAAVHGSTIWCERLRAVPLTHCRADLIVRQALIAPDSIVHGITAYLTACGASPESANAALSRALAAFARTVCPNSTVE